MSKKEKYLVTYDNGAFILGGSGEYLRTFTANDIGRYVIGNRFDWKQLLLSAVSATL